MLVFAQVSSNKASRRGSRTPDISTAPFDARCQGERCSRGRFFFKLSAPGALEFPRPSGDRTSTSRREFSPKAQKVHRTVAPEASPEYGVRSNDRASHQPTRNNISCLVTLRSFHHLPNDHLERCRDLTNPLANERLISFQHQGRVGSRRVVNCTPHPKIQLKTKWCSG